MPDPLWINASAGAPAYSANELRQAMGLAVMYGGRNVGGRQGVRPGGTQLQVSLVSSTITVQPGLAIVDPALSTPQGSYWVAIPVAETHTLTPANATNPRKDIVICRVYDHDEDSSGLRLARSEYIAGVAAASPSEPTVPSGSFRLATIDVPATPGVAGVTDRRPWTVAPGGILPVAAPADIAAAVAGRYRDRLDTGVLERDSGAAWETAADPAQFKAWPSWAPALTNMTQGNGALTATFRQVGKTVDYRFKLVLGNTSVIGTSPRFTLPVAPHASYVGAIDALSDWVLLLDAGTVNRSGIIWSTSGSTVEIFHYTATGTIAPITATVPWTWTTGDALSVKGRYEAA